MQQNHARKIGVSVDSLTFNFTVINRSKDTDDTLNDTKRRLKVKDLGFDVSSQHFMSIYQHDIMMCVSSPWGFLPRKYFPVLILVGKEFPYFDNKQAGLL